MVRTSLMIRVTAFAALTIVATALLTATSQPVQALEVGSTLPPLSIKQPGELVLNGDDIDKAPWQSSAIGNGRPALVFYLPARASSESDIDPLRTKLDQGSYEPGSFHSITIVNLDDAFWGTSGFVEGQVAKNKRAHPRATMVLDAKGKGRKTFSLPEKTTVVFLVNGTGEVIDYREGSISEQAADAIIDKLHTEIAAADAAT